MEIKLLSYHGLQTVHYHQTTLICRKETLDFGKRHLILESDLNWTSYGSMIKVLVMNNKYSGGISVSYCAPRYSGSILSSVTFRLVSLRDTV